ncbi:hypothetical protein BKA82DRAFT_1005468 [Pisolithus tinctorius]|uniref:Uncharacterized protein n=1 Tax=Pisolithus tinctorius Marx 270 TaxID=870435 RepID=A0A0C3NSY0_PISTI|nr:hypothetical protein BKA82DRAFT_1005468 [Pisolithus tinctorius]KIN98333.1 hypothetical protein M404DRAFT_1005468 [Pisolithus tinctorius Marx 270]
MPTQILMRLTQALGILLPPSGFATYLVRIWTVTSRITIDVLRPGTSVTLTLCDSTDATVESAPFTVNAGTSIFCPHATSSIAIQSTAATSTFTSTSHSVNIGPLSVAFLAPSLS